MNRRPVATACLAASPIVYEVTRFVWPKGSEGSTATQLGAAGAHPSAWFAAAFLEAVASWLVVPAALAVAGRLVGRARIFGIVAGVLASFSAVAFSGEAFGAALVTVLGAQSDRSRMVALYDSMTGSGYLAVFIVLIFVGLLGQVLLAWSALAGRLVPWWIPALVTAGVVVETVAPDGVEGATAALYQLPLVAGGLLFAAVLLRRPAPAVAPAARVPAAA